DGGFDLFVEPVVKADYWQDCEALPDGLEAETLLGVRQSLPEREDVGTDARLPQRRDHGHGVPDVLVPLVFEADDCRRTPGESIRLTVDLDALDTDRLPVEESLLCEDTRGSSHAVTVRSHSSNRARLNKSLWLSWRRDWWSS